MPRVNPPPALRIPKKIFNDSELRPFFEQLIQISFQLYTRTGGADDAIVSTQNRDLFDSTSQLAFIDEVSRRVDGLEQMFMSPLALFADLQTQIESLPSDSESIIPARQFNAVSKSAAYTAIDFDFINATAGCTITLPANPDTDSVVIVRNGDGSFITLSGGSRNVDGRSSVVSRQRGTTLTAHYFVTSNEWFLR